MRSFAAISACIRSDGVRGTGTRSASVISANIR